MLDRAVEKSKLAHLVLLSSLGARLVHGNVDAETALRSLGAGK